MFSGQVVIAYARQDQDFVQDMVAELETAGLNVFYDKHLRGGVWREQIAGRLGAADALIVVLTPASVASMEVQSEVQFARDHGVQTIVPVMLERCQPFTPINILQHVSVDHVKEPLRPENRGRKRAVPLAAILGAMKRPGRPKRVFATSDNAEFEQCAEALMRKAKRIVLIGVGLNLLQREPLAREIIHRGASGECQLAIVLANPGSPSVQSRLIEEELGSTRPSIGRPGIYQRVATLLSMWEGEGSPDSVSIRLFNHCPAFALIIIDDDYFLYPYGYRTLGNFSPVVSFSKADDPKATEFFETQYKLIKADSVDAQSVLRFRNGEPPPVESLTPMAIYFVPPARAPLYQFGSEVLGHDIRQRSMTSSPWSDRVGAAGSYGFHLTIGDVLYYATEADAKTAAAEVEFFAREFNCFELTNLRLERNVPAPGSISIVADDPTGSLEALHAEIVARVYRRAIASNYTLGLAEASRDQDIERARLMLNRYHAPYVLARYRPHFTLLTASQNIDSDLMELQHLWEQRRCTACVRVEKLAIVERLKEDAWSIKREVDLG